MNWCDYSISTGDIKYAQFTWAPFFVTLKSMRGNNSQTTERSAASGLFVFSGVHDGQELKAPYSTKRLFDIVGAGAGLLLLAPFLPFIALAIKLDTPGPVIVGLDRVSGGKTITVYKFRSMIRDAHVLKPSLTHLNERGDGPFFKIRRDPRVTRVGRVLRKFRIDEFPQLINVLKGEMSLVGPRPHEPEEVMRYKPEHMVVTLAKAGVTGLSQTSGASSLSYDREIELDLHYIRNASPVLDSKIMARTAAIMFSDPTAV
jgi:lipopolysaccharide/colanic/teichoic acid biosynthesis glycosyltransferase